MAYSTIYVPNAVTDRMRQSHLLGLFIRLDTDPALHIWFGAHEISAGFDSIDEEGTVYLGGGRLLGIPTLEVLMMGLSGSVEFTLSGVNPATGAELLKSIPNVRGALFHVGITTLDDYYQPMSAIIPLWQGIAARTGDSMPVAYGDDARTLTLSLSVVTGENTRSRPSRALWSDAQHRALHPTDDFCKNTNRLSRGVNPPWPNF